jgi:GNAT superfamily N-acetyltransferase
MTMTNDTIDIRDAEAADMPFVVSAWTKSYWDALQVTCPVLAHFINRNHFYNAGQREYIAFCIAAHGCRIAHLKSDPDQIIGFASGSKEAELLHYVYVKSAFRRLGVGRMLAADVVGEGGGCLSVSHDSPRVSWLMRGRPWGLTANWERKRK